MGSQNIIPLHVWGAYDDNTSYGWVTLILLLLLSLVELFYFRNYGANSEVSAETYLPAVFGNLCNKAPLTWSSLEIFC